jgi:hypothetical protein
LRLANEQIVHDAVDPASWRSVTESIRDPFPYTGALEPIPGMPILWAPWGSEFSHRENTSVRNTSFSFPCHKRSRGLYRLQRTCNAEGASLGLDLAI